MKAKEIKKYWHLKCYGLFGKLHSVEILENATDDEAVNFGWKLYHEREGVLNVKIESFGNGKQTFDITSTYPGSNEVIIPRWAI